MRQVSDAYARSVRRYAVLETPPALQLLPLHSESGGAPGRARRARTQSQLRRCWRTCWRCWRLAGSRRCTGASRCWPTWRSFCCCRRPTRYARPRALRAARAEPRVQQAPRRVILQHAGGCPAVLRVTWKL
jgi:hypothetical protein